MNACWGQGRLTILVVYFWQKQFPENTWRRIVNKALTNKSLSNIFQIIFNSKLSFKSIIGGQGGVVTSIGINGLQSKLTALLINADAEIDFT